MSNRENNSLRLAAGLGALLAGLVVFVFLRSIKFTFVVVLAIPLALLTSIFFMFMTNTGTINAMTLGGPGIGHWNSGRPVHCGTRKYQSTRPDEQIARAGRIGRSPRGGDADVRGNVDVCDRVFPGCVSVGDGQVPVYATCNLGQCRDFCFLYHRHHPGSGLLCPVHEGPIRKIGQEKHDGWFEVLFQKTLGRRPCSSLARPDGRRWNLWAVVIFVVQSSWPGTVPTSGRRANHDSGPHEDRHTIEPVRRCHQVDRTGHHRPNWRARPHVRCPTMSRNPIRILQLLVSNIGVLLDWPAAYTPNGGPMDAFILVQTKSRESIFDIVADLRATLNSKYPDIDFAFDTGGMLTAALNMGEPSPIHFQIQSPSLETGQVLGRMIRDIARNVEGAVDARVAQRIDYPVVKVNIDRKKAQDLNVNVEEVMKNLVSATNSSINFDPAFWIDPFKGNHYFLGVQYPEELLNSRDMLLDIPVRGGPDGVVYLRDILDNFEETTAPYVINHRNITRVTDVYVNVLPGYDIGSIVKKVEVELEKLGAEPANDERGQLFNIGTVVDENKDDGKDPEAWSTHPLTNANLYKGRDIRMMGEVKENAKFVFNNSREA